MTPYGDDSSLYIVDEAITREISKNCDGIED